MDAKRIKENVSSIFGAILFTDTVSKEIFKYQPIVHAKSEEEAVRKRYKHVMDRILIEERNQDQRVQEFEYNGRIMYSSFYEVGPTLVDCIRLQLYTRYTTHDNRKTNHLYRLSRRYKARLFRIFGPFNLQYCAVGR